MNRILDLPGSLLALTVNSNSKQLLCTVSELF